MLDIKKVAENSEAVKKSLSKRCKGAEELVDVLKDLYNKKRQLLKEVESLKALRNKASDEIAALKRQKIDCADKIAHMKEVGTQIAALDGILNELEPQLTAAALNIPNLPDESVPLGSDETANVELRRFGTPPTFGFVPKPHWELGESLNILDAPTAAKITGARFTLYRGDGARLERALMNFMLDTHRAAGYTEIFPPFLVNSDSMYGTGQLPKFKEDAFAVADTNYYLVPTAEVPVTNMHRGEVLPQLPLKYCAYTSCFRAEAGSAGRDTRGLIRQHQFQKVELVHFCRSDDSFNQLEQLTAQAERLLQLLGLCYRVVCLCGGDLGFGSAKTYDIEVWLPSYNRFVEISSCSNYVDFQARRMNIKYMGEKGLTLAHTLNGSGLPLGRTAAAIIENYQNADGSVTIPEVLVKYFGSNKIG